VVDLRGSVDEWGADGSDAAAEPEKFEDLGAEDLAAQEATAEVDVVEEELPVLPPVTFIKAPYLQWPTTGSVTLLAETNEETPLDVILAFEGGTEHFYSVPTIPKFQLMGTPLEPLAGFFHQVEVSLPEGVTDFSVTVANGTGDGLDVTLPQSLDSFVMVVFGDTRTQADKHQIVVDAIVEEAPLVSVNTGDMVELGTFVTYWNEFFAIEAELLGSSFFLPVFGNHEVTGEDYFNTLFETGNSFGDERNWWADLGSVGIVGISQYGTDWSKPEPLAWLEEAFEALQDKPWLFLVHHEPMFTFSSHDPWEKGRKFIKPLVDAYGVDVVFAGHNHCYEHFLVDGVHYIVTGGGGAPQYDPGEPSGPDAQYRIAAAAIYHYVKLDLSPTSLHASVINAETGSLFEEFEP